MIDFDENAGTKLNGVRRFIEDIYCCGPPTDVVRPFVDRNIELTGGSKLMEVVSGRGSTRASTYA